MLLPYTFHLYLSFICFVYAIYLFLLYLLIYSTIVCISFNNAELIALIPGPINKLEIGVSHITINIMYSIFSCSSNQVWALVGKNANSIFEPSRGGNGSKLNTHKPTFIAIMYWIISDIILPVLESMNVNPPNLIISPYIIENTMSDLVFKKFEFKGDIDKLI